MNETPIIEMKSVSMRFTKPVDAAGKIANLLGAKNKPEVVHAVNDVSLGIKQGEVVGLVGESGCGKSTLGRMVAGIYEPTQGQILYQGMDLQGLSRTQRMGANLDIQMIFQDPMASLNPRMRVREIVGEAPLFHQITSKALLDDYVATILQRVGLDPVFMRRYPHQFSGGQRARIGIARALAVNPKFLVCDESVAALDVSIQAQVLNLFMQLRQELNLTYLFISHDLGVVKYLSDRVVIMYLGRVVESAPAAKIFAGPNHPYSQALLENVPTLAHRHKRFSSIKGEIPSPLNPPSGCHFHPRCPKVGPRCKSEVPVLRELEAGHYSACHLNDGGTG
ncbi:ABC transporter ATP-binding protein [Orrella daihaiensis]|uniref:ATP-binding cassette domain-containing protein n=1 Tax=Orrella daihaiensis TaxID=2782176 RepID=A0ABY4AJE5_9BURK|nr:oligopeptide/dipeptide ABC transporter ATP-binding protein [Orrella daihaiensis]UOD49520.1 ATP-binding cassette domain-containing protein [Orrella daihaiensis]